MGVPNFAGLAGIPREVCEAFSFYVTVEDEKNHCHPLSWWLFTLVTPQDERANFACKHSFALCVIIKIKSDALHGCFSSYCGVEAVDPCNSSKSRILGGYRIFFYGGGLPLLVVIFFLC